MAQFKYFKDGKWEVAGLEAEFISKNARMNATQVSVDEDLDTKTSGDINVGDTLVTALSKLHNTIVSGGYVLPVATDTVLGGVLINPKYQTFIKTKDQGNLYIDPTQLHAIGDSTNGVDTDVYGKTIIAHSAIEATDKVILYKGIGVPADSDGKISIFDPKDADATITIDTTAKTISATAASATTATNDANGKKIDETYVEGASEFTNAEIDAMIADAVPNNIINAAPIGHVQWQYVVEDGYLKCDGAAVSRDTYKDLWAWVQKNSLVTTKDQTQEPHLFGNGDGKTTFNTPNLMARVLEGGTAVSLANAGLPEITGRTWSPFYTGLPLQSGPFVRSVENPTLTYLNQTNGTEPSVRGCYLDFYASKANAIYGASTTVQPPAVILIPQIKF